MGGRAEGAMATAAAVGLKFIPAPSSLSSAAKKGAGREAERAKGESGVVTRAFSPVSISLSTPPLLFTPLDRFSRRPSSVTHRLTSDPPTSQAGNGDFSLRCPFTRGQREPHSIRTRVLWLSVSGGHAHAEDSVSSPNLEAA